MQAGEGVALARLGDVVNRGPADEQCGWGRSARDRRMSVSSQTDSDRLISSGMDARLARTSPPCFWSFRSSRYSTWFRSAGKIQPRSTSDSPRGKFFASGPEGAGLDELVGSDQVHLQGEHTEEQVPIGVHEASAGGLLQSTCYSEKKIIHRQM